MRRHWLFAATIVLGVLAPVAVAAGPVEKEDDSARPAPLRLRDDFSDRLALDWNIIREDATHYSLSKNPGRLTITTQRGAIHGDSDRDRQSGGIRTKNMFFLKNPVEADRDFSITLAVTKFEPTTFYHQFALLCYDDDDNYLKWTYEYTWRKPGTTCFTLVREIDKEPVHDLIYDLPFPGKLWIRVTKRGPEYVCSYSTDGRTFPVVGSRPWISSAPKYLGFFAKNGGNPDAPEIDVAIDSFELASPPADETPAGE